MHNEFIDRWNEMTQNAWKPFLELSDIATRAAERAGQQQMEFINDYLSEGARYAESVTKVKDMKEFFDLQTQMVTGYSEKLFNVAKLNFETCLQTGNEMGKWVESELTGAAFQPTPGKTA